MNPEDFYRWSQYADVMDSIEKAIQSLPDGTIRNYPKGYNPPSAGVARRTKDAEEFWAVIIERSKATTASKLEVVIPDSATEVVEREDYVEFVLDDTKYEITL